MTIILNHTIVPARDKLAAARFFASIFGLNFNEQESDHFAPVQVNETLTLLFDQDTSFDSHHYAFHVSDGESRQGGAPGGDQQWLISVSAERTIIESLNLYFEFMREFSKVAPPYTVEVGLHGVRGRLLVIHGATIGSSGKVFEDGFELRRVLHNTDLKTLPASLTRWYRNKSTTALIGLAFPAR
jgi:hypothetical protein